MTPEFTRELLKVAPKLRRFAWSLTNDRTLADDLVQSACERAIRNADAFRPGTRFDSWMYKIIQNLWLDERRRMARHRTEEVDEEAAALSDQGAASGAAEARLALQRVREAMDALPDGQRAVISLVAIEGRSYRETAEILDIPTGTVMSRLTRARARLSHLADEYGGGRS